MFDLELRIDSKVARARTPARRQTFSKTTKSLLTERGVWSRGIHL